MNKAGIIGLIIAIALVLGLARNWVSFGFSGAHAINDFSGNGDIVLPADPARGELPAEIRQAEEYKSVATDLLKNLHGGQVTNSDIQAQLIKITGEATPLRWDQLRLNKPYKLVFVLTHVQDLDNGFQLLHSHTLAGAMQADDSVTLYNQKINGAEEKTIGGSLVISRLIEPQRGPPTFAPDSQVQYFFGLKPSLIGRPFGLRAPKGEIRFAEARKSSFNPLDILTTARSEGNFDEIAEYQYERQIGQSVYIIGVTPRITDMGTLTIAAEIRQAESLLTHEFVLVYEPL